MRGAGEDTRRSGAGCGSSTRVDTQMGEVGGLGVLSSAFKGWSGKLCDPVCGEDQVGRLQRRLPLEGLPLDLSGSILGKGPGETLGELLWNGCLSTAKGVRDRLGEPSHREQSQAICGVEIVVVLEPGIGGWRLQGWWVGARSCERLQVGAHHRFDAIDGGHPKQLRRGRSALRQRLTERVEGRLETDA